MIDELACPACGEQGCAAELRVAGHDQRFVALRDLVVAGAKRGVTRTLARQGDRLSERQVIGHGLIVGVDVIEAPGPPPLQHS